MAKNKNEIAPEEQEMNPSEEMVLEENTPQDAGTLKAPAEESAGDGDKLEKLQAELEESKDKYLRLLAEYDNYRKRSIKEKEKVYTDIKAATITEFLPVYDNLERALLQHTDDEAYYKGVELIMAQLKTVFEQMDVTIFAEVGDGFDPEMHSGIMHEQDETLGENVIAEVFQRGFKLGDKVIRFALVKVAN